jgi:hypothetical protein
MNALLGAEIVDVYQVCLDLDGLLEDIDLALLKTSKGVFQFEGAVHSEERVVGLRLIQDIAAPRTVVDFAPYSMRTRLVDGIGDSFVVAEIQYVQEGGAGGEPLLNVGGFLFDATGEARLVMWAAGEEAFVARPESVWAYSHRWIRHVREVRVVSVRASDIAAAS